MRNIKDRIYEALSSITVQEGGRELRPEVSDAYPTQWGEASSIQITEEQNSVYERAGNVETKSMIRYRIDIWDRRSTSKMALAVDNAVSALGFVRTSCSDVPDPSAMKHKQLRYEGIIEISPVSSDRDVVYWDI
jgi:hypothetical protein